MSCRQSRHSAKSGGTRACFRLPGRLSTTEKPSSPRRGSSSRCTRSNRARGGRAAESVRRKPSTSSASPSTSITAPSGELATKPERPQATAWRYTAGRKPTPCTTPVQVRRTLRRAWRPARARASDTTPPCPRRFWPKPARSPRGGLRCGFAVPPPPHRSPRCPKGQPW